MNILNFYIPSFQISLSFVHKLLLMEKSIVAMFPLLVIKLKVSKSLVIYFN